VAGIEQLIAEGYLTAVTGAGTVVNPRLTTVHPGLRAAERVAAPPPAPDRPLGVDLTPGRPDAARLVDPS